jgi:hypothetical protein
MKRVGLGSLLVILLSVGCSTSPADRDTGALPTVNISFKQALAGLWCNSDYNRFAETNKSPNLFPGKWIFGEINNKVFVFPFDKTTDEDWNTDYPHWYEIEKQWSDDRGRINFHLRWYWMISFQEGREYFFQLSLSPQLDFYEFTMSPDEFPSEIDPNDPMYHIYYRCPQE